MFAFLTRGKRRPPSQSEAGSAALELGLLAPVLVLLLVGIAELGTGAYQAMQVQNAAEAGAIYASKHDYNITGIVSAVVNSRGTTGITASPGPTSFCGCPSASGLVAMDCSATCADGSDPALYVQINARVTHTPLMTFSSWSVPQTLIGRAFVRLY